MDKNFNIALLIDAENISSNYLNNVINEIAHHGTTTYRRIYGDWTKELNSSWKKNLLEYSITPMQQYNYTVGKNSSDSAMIIDAMDILYTGNVSGFCLVTSDSDFTKLAARLREGGMHVVGMGELKTPKSFRSACSKFITLEALLSQPETTENTATENPELLIANLTSITDKITTIIHTKSDDDGWAYLGEVGNILSRQIPDFDCRNYGFKKLSKLLTTSKKYEIRKELSPTNQNIAIHYIRVKA